MKMRVLAFVPYEAMRTTICDAQKNYPDLSIDMIVGTYDEYLEKSANIDIGQYDCIFARGYTAQVLEKTSIIPVSEIKVSLYDMLRAITTARLRKVPFAILASANILETAHQVIDILQYQDIFTYDIESEEEADAYLASLAGQGIQLVVGDVYAVNAAQRANIPNILITSSRASIDDTIQDAINNRQQHLLIYEKLNLTAEIIRKDISSVVVYDQGGRVVFSNLISLPIAYRQLEKTLRKLLDKLTSSQEESYCVSRAGSTCLRISGRRLNLDTPYYAFYIQTVEMPASAPRQGIQIIYPSEETLSEINDRIYELPRKFLAPQAASLSARAPTVIIGGVGSGKALLAKYLWCTGPFQSVTLTVMDCAALRLSALESFIRDPDSPLYDGQAVLLLKDLHALPTDCQQVLCQFLEDTSFSMRHPLIVTCIEHPNVLLSRQKLLLRLCDYMVGSCLYIENLDRRPEDLAAAAGALINKYNLELGQEVIGLTPKALEALQNFHWSSNMNQFKSVIRQLVSTVEQHYISLEPVASVLAALDAPGEVYGNINTAGTLDEIERRIILSVLQEENMNYTSTAKRLNISRSTLYRKLKPEKAGLLPSCT